MFPKLSVLLSSTLLLLSGVGHTQNYFSNNYGRNAALGWSKSPLPGNTDDPAISVYGKDGGPAAILGSSKAGVYLIVLKNEKVFLYNGSLTPVAKLPDNISLNHLDRVITPTGHSYIGDPYLPYPAGRCGPLSWGYSAGTVTLSFPAVYIKGDGVVIYNGFDNTGSYLTNPRTKKFLKWDGKTLTEIDKIAYLSLRQCRDIFVATGMASVSNDRHSGRPFNQVNKPANWVCDPFLRTRDRETAKGLWGQNSQLGWYYPMQGASYITAPVVTVYGKEGGDAVYHGYDVWGSYLTVKGKNLLWDGENLLDVDQIPADLFNNQDIPANKSSAPASQPTAASGAAANGDPFCPPGGKGNNFISWTYDPGHTDPKIYLGPPMYTPEPATYHGYDERGAYFTWSDQRYDPYNLLWDGANIIPVEHIPPHLHNAH